MCSPELLHGGLKGVNPAMLQAVLSAMAKTSPAATVAAKSDASNTQAKGAAPAKAAATPVGDTPAQQGEVRAALAHPTQETPVGPAEITPPPINMQQKSDALPLAPGPIGVGSGSGPPIRFQPPGAGPTGGPPIPPAVAAAIRARPK